MRKISFLLILISIKAYSASLPNSLTEFSVWKGINPGQKTIFNIYSVKEIESKIVVTFHSSSKTEEVKVDPKSAYILTEKEVEKLNLLIPQIIDANGEWIMASVQGKGTSEWTITVRSTKFPPRTVGGPLSDSALEAIKLITNAVNDNKHLTLQK